MKCLSRAGNVAVARPLKPHCQIEEIVLAIHLAFSEKRYHVANELMEDVSPFVADILRHGILDMLYKLDDSEIIFRGTSGELRCDQRAIADH